MLASFAVARLVANHGGPMAGVDGLVVHVAQGNGSLFGWFDDPANQVSSHFWVSKTGVIEQYVDTDLEAWAQEAGNANYLSVETEGFVAEPFTGPQMSSLALVAKWASLTFGFPPQLVDHGGRGITTHAHWPSGVADPSWGGHPCPGPVRAGQLPQLVALITPPPVPKKPATTKENPLYVVHTTDTDRQYQVFDSGKVSAIASTGFGSALTGPADPTHAGLPYLEATQADIDAIARGYTPPV